MERNFSRCAHLYDAYADIQRIAADRLMRLLPSSRVTGILEIGCGTGYYTYRLKKKFGDARLRALDISGEMIEIARKKLRGEGIEFVVGDAEAIRPDDVYSLITSNAAFQWFGDLNKTIANYKGALAEKGALVFSTFGPMTFRELSYCLREWDEGKSVSSDGFLPASELRRILKTYFTKVSVKELMIKESHHSLTGLLKKIKYTGTRGYGISGSARLGRDSLRIIENIYKTKFGRIEATYQILFCKATG